MTLLLSAGWGFFAWQMRRRWRLMRLGPSESRFDRIGERLRRTWKYAFVQKRMRRYWWAGAAHGVIFVGFGVLILRSVMLFGRGYSTDFDFWGILAEGSTLGDGYSFVKDGVAVMVILATLVFFYYRVVKKLPRMTLSFEGLLILMIIEVMMWADLLHDGAIIASGAESAGFIRHAPAGSILAMAPATLVFNHSRSCLLAMFSDSPYSLCNCSRSLRAVKDSIKACQQSCRSGYCVRNCSNSFTACWCWFCC